MSGGSYAYFYLSGADNLRSTASTLESMAARCLDPEAWGREEVDANDLAEVAAYLQALAIKVRGAARAVAKLEQVTKDIEWWTSGDTGPDRVVESFGRFVAERASGEAKP